MARDGQWDTWQADEIEPHRHRTPTRRPVLVATGSVRQHFVCAIETHQAVKADPARWDALGPAKFMPAYSDDDERPMVLALKNCSCGSTLAREEEPTTEEALAVLRTAGLL